MCANCERILVTELGKWFDAKQPKDISQETHIDNPTVGLSTEEDKKLAIIVSKMYKLELHK
jgi:hypothetical protein